MPVQINITGDNAVQAHKEFITFHALMIGGSAQVAATVEEVPAEVKTEVKKQSTRKKEEQKNEPVTPPEDQDQETSETDQGGTEEVEESDVTLEELRALASGLNRVDVKAMLDSFGVPNLTKLPKKKYGEAHEKLKELSGE